MSRSSLITRPFLRRRRRQHSAAASFRMVVPLGIGQAPAASERLVELHVREEPVAPDLGQYVLRRVELLLGLEHLEIAGESLPIPVHGILGGLLERLHRRSCPVSASLSLPSRVRASETSRSAVSTACSYWSFACSHCATDAREVPRVRPALRS